MKCVLVTVTTPRKGAFVSIFSKLITEPRLIAVCAVRLSDLNIQGEYLVSMIDAYGATVSYLLPINGEIDALALKLQGSLCRSL